MKRSSQPRVRRYFQFFFLVVNFISRYVDWKQILLLCCDAVGWVTRRASAPKQTCVTYPQRFSSGLVDEDSGGGTG